MADIVNPWNTKLPCPADVCILSSRPECERSWSSSNSCGIRSNPVYRKSDAMDTLLDKDNSLESDLLRWQ